jgi:molecular chaperone GrpE
MTESIDDAARSEAMSEGGGGGSRVEQSHAAALEPMARIEFLEAELTRLEGEKQEMLRLAQSRQAEFENFRRRSEREKQETVDLAAGETVRSLLGVLDDFERAILVETADANYAKGVGLIHSRLKETLEKMGLEAVAATGQMFDPNLHMGIDRVETEEAEDQTILAELQKGYLFRGKLLRPAMVRVAVKK